MQMSYEGSTDSSCRQLQFGTMYDVFFVKWWVPTNTNVDFRWFPRWEKNRDMKKIYRYIVTFSIFLKIVITFPNVDL
jgi:hypothetical protein